MSSCTQRHYPEALDLARQAVNTPLRRAQIRAWVSYAPWLRSGMLAAARPM
jgi:hypothetical protein